MIIALIQLTKIVNDFKDPHVNFTRYQLIELLGWDHSGKSYARLDEALRRWTEVTLHYTNAWRDAATNAWASPSFTMIGDYIPYEFRNRSRSPSQPQMSLPFSSFRWSDIIFRNLTHGHLKNLDYSLYRSLRSPISKQMFRFLDKRFHWADRIDFDLRNFAFEHIGLSRAYDTGKIKERLASPLDEPAAA